jgi:hypothetical protein
MIHVNLTYDGSPEEAQRALRPLAIDATYAMFPTRLRLTLPEENVRVVRESSGVSDFQIARSFPPQD